ncbi:40s ribosomal protein s2 [Moniliophthora roreri]|nr:40s ribosomal protein s2 [Moniliophthora roreri]
MVNTGKHALLRCHSPLLLIVLASTATRTSPSPSSFATSASKSTASTRTVGHFALSEYYLSIHKKTTLRAQIHKIGHLHVLTTSWLRVCLRNGSLPKLFVL